MNEIKKAVGGATGGMMQRGANAIGDMVFGAGENKKQLEQQKKLQDLATGANKEIANYNQKLALEMWDKTNYSAQLAQLEKAGLSKSLMYAGGGAGGSTQGAGEVQGVGAGNADGVAQGMMAKAQMAQVEAGIELTKAQTEKTTAETSNIKTGEQGTELDNQLKTKTIDFMAELAETNVTSQRESIRGMQLANNFEEFLQDQNNGDGKASLKEREVRTRINATIKEMNVADGLIEKMKSEIGEIGASTKEIMSNTKLKTQLFEQLEKTNPKELESLETNIEIQKKELEKMKNDPNYTKWGQYIDFTLKSANSLGDVIQQVRGGKVGKVGGTK